MTNTYTVLIVENRGAGVNNPDARPFNGQYGIVDDLKKCKLLNIL